MSASRRLNALE
ncbi:hypothetical protein KGM_205507A, partial [Danaus plexippus plexippus]